MSYSTFPEILFLLIFGTVFVCLTVRCKSAGAQKILKAIWIVLLIVYASALIWMALIDRSAGDTRSLNLTLFSSYRFMLTRYNSFDIVKQIIDNILVFVPLGILLPAAYSAKHDTKNYIFVVFTGMAVSLIIESLQYIFSIGFSEIDDIFNNAWGCAVGCGIYALTSRIEAKKDSVILKKGWVSCLMPLILFVLIFGVIWCYREFYLCMAALN